jgi:hypothetical protein
MSARFGHTGLIAIVAMLFALDAGAQSSPALFEATLVIHAFGNDVTTGAKYPFNTDIYTALPLGHRCGMPEPYTVNGSAASNYCGRATLAAGQPLTAAGTLTPLGSGPQSFALGQSVFAGSASGSIPTYGPYIYSGTYANIANAAGSFFAGGGPGSFTVSPKNPLKGTISVTAGENQFGGVMGLLGELGARMIYKPNQGATKVGTSSWNMVPVLGRSASFMHTNTGMFTNVANGATSYWTKIATGFPWTTGRATVHAKAGFFHTTFRRTGYDNRTSMGHVGTIQLVTPQLTHWRGVGRDADTGSIGILTLRFVPEPGTGLTALAGVGVLALLAQRRMRNRRS